MLFHLKTHGFHEAIPKHEKPFLWSKHVNILYYIHVVIYLWIISICNNKPPPLGTVITSENIQTTSQWLSACTRMHATYLQRINIALQHSDYILLLINPVSKTHTTHLGNSVVNFYARSVCSSTFHDARYDNSFRDTPLRLRIKKIISFTTDNNLHKGAIEYKVKWQMFGKQCLHHLIPSRNEKRKWTFPLWKKPWVFS